MCSCLRRRFIEDPKNYNDEVARGKKEDYIYTVFIRHLPDVKHAFLGFNQNTDHIECFVSATESALGSPNSLWYKFDLPQDAGYQVLNLNNSIWVNTDQRKLSIWVSSENGYDENDKRVCINQLAVDKLYIHALFFIYLIDKLDWVRNDANLKQYEVGRTNLIEIFQEMNQSYSMIRTLNLEAEEKEFIKKSLKEFFEEFDIFIDENWLENCKNSTLNFRIVKEQNTDDNSHLSKYFKSLLPKIYLFKVIPIVDYLNTTDVFWITCARSQDDAKLLTAYIKAMHFYKTDFKTDLIYESQTKKLAEDLNEQPFDPMPHSVGDFEEKIKTKYEKANMKAQGIFAKSVVWNHKIRQILSENCFLGVIGLKNTGKSTLTKLISGSVTIKTGFHVETNQLAAYPIAELSDLLMVDYPNFESETQFYRKQFSQSIYMLDYALILCNAQKGLTDEFNEMLNEVKHLGTGRFCIILNMMDMLINYFNKNSLKKDVDDFIQNFKNDISNIIKSNDNLMLQLNDGDECDLQLEVIPTCLKVPKNNALQTIEELDEAGIFYEEKLRNRIFRRMFSMANNDALMKRIRGSYTFFFTYTPPNQTEKVVRVCLSQNQNTTVNASSERNNLSPVSSFDELKKVLKEELKIRSNGFLIKSFSTSQEISSFEQFFLDSFTDIEFFVIETDNTNN